MSVDDAHRPPMSAPFSVQTRSIASFEELRLVVPSARTEVTQVDRGRLQGSLTHFSIGGLPLDLGTFSLGVRSRGVVSEDRITIGMLTGRTNRVTHWSYDMQPADVVVWSPKAEHDARYYGGASVGHFVDHIRSGIDFRLRAAMERTWRLDQKSLPPGCP